MPAKAGTCSFPDCVEPRHQFSSGKYALYCQEHQNQRQREYAAKMRNHGMVMGVKLPTHIRIIARRCMKCAEKLPSTWDYFNLHRDKPPRYFWLCHSCAESFGLWSAERFTGQAQDAAPVDPLTKYPCPPCDGSGAVFKNVRGHVERVRCGACKGAGEVDGATYRRYRDEFKVTK